MMDKLLLADASDEQVRTFARTFLQLPDADALGIKQLRAKIPSVWAQDFVWIAKEPEPVQTAAPAHIPQSEIEARAGAGIAPTSSKGDPVVVVIISKMPGPGGSDPVFVNVNSNAMHIARGIRQAVPYRFFADLKNAVQLLREWDEKTNQINCEIVDRYPMNIVSMPTDDDIYEYERKDMELCGQTLTREDWEARRVANEKRRQKEEEAVNATRRAA